MCHYCVCARLTLTLLLVSSVVVTCTECGLYTVLLKLAKPSIHPSIICSHLFLWSHPSSHLSWKHVIWKAAYVISRLYIDGSALVGPSQMWMLPMRCTRWSQSSYDQKTWWASFMKSNRFAHKSPSCQRFSPDSWMHVKLGFHCTNCLSRHAGWRSLPTCIFILHVYLRTWSTSKKREMGKRKNFRHSNGGNFKCPSVKINVIFF